MEFFALAQCPLTETQIQDTLRGQQLADWCATINRVLHWEDEQGEIYSLWGQFRVRRELIRGGVRFTLPECPNALAWTLTVAPPAVGGEASPGIQVHCTINRTEHDPEFIATLEDFVDDWRQGLERLAGEQLTPRDAAPP